MPLILKVASYCLQSPDPELVSCFERRGGIIGRSPDCVLCLPDPGRYVSRRHVEVQFRGGAYFVANIGSGNPVNLNGITVVRGHVAQLNDGDILQIGDYLIQARIASETGATVDAVLPFEMHSSFADIDHETEEAQALDVAVGMESFLDSSLAPTIIGSLSGQLVPFRGSEADVFPEIYGEMPSLSLVREELPDDYDFLHGVERILPATEASFTERSQVIDTPPSGTDNPGLDANDEVARAGDGLDFNDPVAKYIVALREFVVGIKSVLLGQARVMKELGITRKQSGSNELGVWFAIPGDEVLVQHLISEPVADDPASGNPIRSGFREVQAHQLALMAGSRAALDALMQRFDPKQIEQQLGRKGWWSRLRPGARRARAWRVYVERYDTFHTDDNQGLERLFTEAFAQAYGEQLQKLGDTEEAEAQSDDC